jgi:hypothetical protein
MAARKEVSTFVGSTISHPHRAELFIVMATYKEDDGRAS